MEGEESLEDMRKTLKVHQDSYLVGFISGGVASWVAETFTLPLDTAKVRMQIYGMKGKYASITSTLSTIKNEQGFFALWNSLSWTFPICPDHVQTIFAERTARR